MKNKIKRKTFQIRVYNHIHTLIEQQESRNHYPGNYLGHKGYVLKKTEKIILN